MAQLQVTKGQTKKLPKGKSFTAGLGWDVAPGKDSVDLDYWLLRKDDTGTIVPVFWGNSDLHRPDLGKNSEGNPWIVTVEEDVIHKGDDRTGAESDTGYDEIIILDLGKTPPGVIQYAFFATIYDESNAGLTLGMATNVKCGVKEEDTGHELVTNLESDHGFDVSVLICTIDLDPATGDWSMTSVQQGYTDTMMEVAKKLGVIGFP